MPLEGSGGATSGQVIVRPGDFILFDNDGGIVIPSQHVEAVLSEAERLTRTEALVREEIADGMTLKEALDKYGHI